VSGFLQQKNPSRQLPGWVEKKFYLYGSSGKRVPEARTRLVRAPRLMPPSSRAGGGIDRQNCLSVSEFFGVPPLASKGNWVNS